MIKSEIKESENIIVSAEGTKEDILSELLAILSAIEYKFGKFQVISLFMEYFDLPLKGVEVVKDEES